MTESLAVAVGIVCVCVAFSRSYTDMDLETRKMMFVRTIGVMLWPSILTAAIGHGQYCDCRVIPIMWNLVVWAIDMLIIHNNRGRTHPPINIKLDPHCVTSVGFGVCSWLGLKPGDKVSRIFMLAILGCITVVYPTMSDDAPCVSVMRCIQSVVLAWCIGLVIAGMCLGLKMKHQ